MPLRDLTRVEGRDQVDSELVRRSAMNDVRDSEREVVRARDVQIAARHADPRTTMRYDRARKNLDWHPNYILAAYMASGT
jgi:hypothetical protein